MTRRAAIAVLAAALGLPALTPAASQAATCAVGSGGTYLTIGAALADPACTDIQVRPGSYNEGALTLARSSVTVSATPGTVSVTGSANTPNLTVAGADAVIRGLSFASGTGIRVTGARATIDRVRVISSGNGIDVSGNAAKVLRTTAVSVSSGYAGLLVRATGSADRTATVDSSVLAGNGRQLFSGLTTRSETASSGDVTVSLVHATVFGGATIGPRTSAKASRSLVAAGVAGGMTLESSLNNAPAGLFRDPALYDFHLRADAASAIDKDGAVKAGESDVDVDGEPRVVGAGSDLGADEFLNQAPSAALKVSRVTPRQNATVTFDASASTDPEAAWGGGVVRYEWDFGDGTTDESTTPTIEHSYFETGKYAATVHVVDAQGAAATSTPLSVRVRDGLAPAIRFLSPRPLSTVTGSLLSVFRGTARDRNGIRSVTLSLRQTKMSNGRRPHGRCRYINARTARYVFRSCSRPLFFRVHWRKGRWSYATHGRFFLRPGRWQTTIHARDKAGNLGSRTIKFAVR